MPAKPQATTTTSPSKLTKRERTIFVQIGSRNSPYPLDGLRDHIHKKTKRHILASVTTTAKGNLVLLTNPTIKASSILPIVRTALKLVKGYLSATLQPLTYSVQMRAVSADTDLETLIKDVEKSNAIKLHATPR